MAKKQEHHREIDEDACREVMHPFSQCNFWTGRIHKGAYDRAFKTAEELLIASEGYFDWANANPMYEEEVYSYKGTVTRTHKCKMRSFTLEGLCLHLCVSSRTFQKWRKHNPELQPAIEIIDDIIRTQKFEGAAANMLNASLISRDLGIADKHEHTGADGGPIETAEVSPRERIAGRIARLAERGGADSDTGESE